MPAQQAHELLREAWDMRMERLGFEKTKEHRWARQRCPGVIDLLHVLAMKGSSYSPTWATSLAWVPHVSGSKAQWHRTAKSALTDIGYDPIDFECRNVGDARNWYAHRFQSSRDFRASAKRVAEASLRIASPFWDRVTDAQSALDTLDWLRTLPTSRFAFQNYPQQSLAYAFTLAKLGLAEEAEAALDAHLSEYEDSRPAEAELRAKLAATEP